MTEFKLTPAPPPAEAPIQPEADAAGLIAGLRVGRSGGRGGPYRCSACHKLVTADVPSVMVPDGVRIGDDSAAVTEVCRRSAFNGHFSGWCLPCAKKLSGKPSLPEWMPSKSVWRRVLSALGL